MGNRNAMNSDNKLKLGLFGSNCSSGRIITKMPERWSGSWADNANLGELADAAGIEFMLPVGRWKGYGGETDYQGATFETINWASGLLAKTKRLTVFGTVHAPLIHPVVAAKAMMTADHIGQGRFGLNLVVGWNEDEFEMFGIEQRDHAKRYDYGEEWLNAVKMMWERDEEFDYDGAFFKLKKVRAKPKPYGGTRPIIMNAGQSPVGQTFALKNCDAIFIAPPPGGDNMAGYVSAVKEKARNLDRAIDVYSAAFIVCRPTKQEAEDYHRYATVETADWDAIDHILHMSKYSRESHPDTFDKMRANMTNGMGGVPPIIGDADFVAGELAKLHSAGFTGIGITLVHYGNELPFFAQEVLPRLEKLGIRQPV